MLTIRRELRRRFRHIVGPAFGALLVLYFLLNAIYGDRGLLAFMHSRAEVQRAEISLAEVRAERRQLETRVAQIGGGVIDRDLLDSEARWLGGLALPGDLVIRLPAQ